MASHKHTTPSQPLLPLVFPEVWRPVLGFEDIYEVSDQGRVRSFDRVVAFRKGGSKRIKGKILKPLSGGARGYAHVCLWRESQCTMANVHRIVLEAFVGERPAGYGCNHKDGDKTNNALTNLEWVTYRENTQHARRTGLWRHEGEDNPTSLLTTVQVLEIRRLARQGVSQSALGHHFHVNHGTIWSIVHRITWKHLPEEGEST
jgi:hypothetical protein